jgi:hypothetical protein
MSHYVKPKRPTPTEVVLTAMLGLALGWLFLTALGVN